jgi:orotate phosphoribosyltransferase
LSKSLAQRIYETSHLTGEFRLRSGSTSNEYFDKYLFEADPALLDDIARGMTDLIPEGTEYLAGLEMGGIPVVTLLSHYSGIPALFVRKKAKEHGTEKLAEGQDFSGRRVTIVEDVVSTGGQIVLSTNDLRERGAVIAHALCVIDRESGGKENLEEASIALRSLLTMSDLVASQS